MDFTEGYVEGPYGRTWYRVTGDLGSAKTPLVILHGGPGCTHDYVDSFKDLAATGRAVIHYDQLGNGRSTHLPERKGDGDFWTVDLFNDELNRLTAHLGIAGSYDVLGQSWGGMLGAEHAVRQPKGLRRLVIANSPASLKTWVEEANRLRRDMPQDIQDALTRNEEAGTIDSAEYQAASDAFYALHVCRVVPMPPEVRRTFDAIATDPTVYHTMNGPTEFHVIGSMKNWTIESRLHTITVPTFLISGRYDEATPLCVQPYADHIPDVRWTIFENSSHMPHVEEKEACLAAVAAFLDA
ncbi:proline iminopeptidase-family hydrolase [Acidisoma silvae]|uniref:Proline iminopeptidase-family hydrolase n=1 Tax=Acidisoma silvae TaxID=2802396 RepID=A0A963YNF7_9PROT|nr:proline iminopeptidase-family hydrolase [Acidisoma silvae]MCB8873756.1 proline iminopeptidase-family hydrolase [Acidisoma silvae]